MENMSIQNQNKIHPEDRDEDILQEVKSRYVLFPILNPDIWKMYKMALSSFWTAEEIDLSKDLNDWEKLSENEQYFIKNVLAFFAASDGIVNENLSVRFMNEIPLPEAKSFYGLQIAMENIHCVAKDTEILTDKGYFNIEYLAKKCPNVKVWNGHEFSSVQVVQTSTASPLYRVTLSNGMELKCTGQHKWLIKDHEDRVFTENLEPGMQIQPFAYPDNSDVKHLDFEIFSNPEDHGKECAQFDKGQDDYDLVKYNMRNKYQIPMNYSRDTKIKWLSGFFSINTKLYYSETNLDLVNDKECLITQSTEHDFLRIFPMFLSCLNVKVEYRKGKDETGRDISELVFDKYNVAKMAYKGIKVSDDLNVQSALIGIYEDILSKGETQLYEEEQGIFVKKVERMDGLHPTYCFNEPLRHTGIFNGILTGQSETYSLLIDTYIKDKLEKDRLLNAVETIPIVRKKADWAIKWILNEDSRFAKRLIAFACVEGIFFSGSFCAIFWLKERGVMPGLCLSNEFISRDEGLHTEFACLLYSLIKKKLPQEEVYEMIREAVEMESEFINDSIPCALLGMNSTLMNQYIRFVADRLLFQLGYEKIWNEKNPFDFMDRICLENKSNFFEHTRLSEYAKTNVGGSAGGNTFEFSTNEDF